MPAQSPTLSPTLSAITAGLRGSSSGMPASTLPTRSAPTSAALVKMPPPRRAKIEIERGAERERRQRRDDLPVIGGEAHNAGEIVKSPAMASRPRPATSMPVMAPERKASVRPPCSDVRAASAVRTLARTEMFMPT